jgi:hypothetical protein
VSLSAGGREGESESEFRQAKNSAVSDVRKMPAVFAADFALARAGAWPAQSAGRLRGICMVAFVFSCRRSFFSGSALLVLLLGMLSGAASAQTNALRITRQPLPVEALPGDPADLSVWVETPTNALSFSWLFTPADSTNAQPFIGAGDAVTNTPAGGFIGFSVIQFRPISRTNAGRYQATVSDGANTVTSVVAQVTVPPAVIVRQPRSQGAFLGGTATFSVVARGLESEAITGIRWFFNTNSLLTDYPVSETALTNAGVVTVTSTLSVTNLVTTNAGTFTAVVTNRALAASSSSTAASLVLASGAPVGLTFDNATNHAPGIARFPLFLSSAFFDVNELALTLRFDPAAVGDFRFVNWDSGVVITNVPGTQTNVVEVTDRPGFYSLLLRSTNVLPAGDGSLALLEFRHTGSLNDALRSARLDVVTDLDEDPVQPLPTGVRSTNGVTSPLTLTFSPQLQPGGMPRVNRQNGLVEVPMELINLTPSAISEVRVRVFTNLLTATEKPVGLASSLGSTDGGFSVFVFAGGVGARDTAAGTAPFLLEFFTEDRRTNFFPRLSFLGESIALDAFALPTTATATNEFQFRTEAFAVRPGEVILRLHTRTNYFYYVQYTDAATNLLTTNVVTSRPFLRGNGGPVDWIDNGPPRTLTVPGVGTNGVPTRFYQILEFR